MRLNSSFTLFAFVAGVWLSPVAALGAESVLERVNASGILRCGYAVWPGIVDKDPNSGKLSGVFVDFMEELGRVAELKIEWAGEYGWADFIEALHADKIDAMCAGIWTNAVRGRRVLFSEPIAFESVVPIVRADDMRFDRALEKLNDPSVKLIVVDGESAKTVASGDFPKATQISLPQRTDASVMIAHVLNRKGDATFVDTYTAADFQTKNPGQIKIIPSPFPVRIFGLSIGLKLREDSLKAMLDNATRQLLWTGVVEKIILKNEAMSIALLRVRLPYETATVK